jgi:CheY-like chemotaxis protein
MAESLDPTIAPGSNPGCILYAEDEEHDVFFFEQALETISSPYKLTAVPNGEQVIDYLSGKGAFADRSRHPLPALILLDINMPRKTGLEVLEWIRQQPHFKSLPVLMFTSSSRLEDSDRARQFGAEDYLLKPSDTEKLVELVKMLHTRWLSWPSPPILRTHQIKGTAS